MRFRFGSAVGWSLQAQSPSGKGARVATSIHRQIAKDLGVREQQVEAAVALLGGDATVFAANPRVVQAGHLRS
jgi:hypothetical protein